LEEVLGAVPDVLQHAASVPLAEQTKGKVSSAGKMPAARSVFHDLIIAGPGAGTVAARGNFLPLPDHAADARDEQIESGFG